VFHTVAYAQAPITEVKEKPKVLAAQTKAEVGESSTNQPEPTLQFIFQTL
jgi:hypothetical protein